MLRIGDVKISREECVRAIEAQLELISTLSAGWRLEVELLALDMMLKEIK